MPQDITLFVRRWQVSQRTERSGYQDHFRDLCDTLGFPAPSQADEIGNNYTFERHVTKAGGGRGFATSGVAAGSPGSTNPKAAISTPPIAS